MRLLCTLILILFGTVGRFWHDLSPSYRITAQFVRDDLPGFSATVSQQASEEPFSRCTITFCLKIHINHCAVLVDCSSQIVLLTFDLDEYFVDVKRVAIASVISFKASGV
jgi:hypothetical protein